MIKKRILLLYPYYWPFFRAGGPVQSLYNLAANFSAQCEFYLISYAKDISGDPSAQSIVTETWMKGPNNENIFYSQTISPILINQLAKEIRPDIVFINGIFHWNTSFFGVLLARLHKIKVIISPRGMLQAWGLRRRPVKKKIYLTLFKCIFSSKAIWHATDEQEKIDILNIFGNRQEVHIASNIPRALSSPRSLSFPDLNKKIKLVFLSLINPNKNLHLVIDSVNQLSDSFTLDIYGPIIDNNYWAKCKQMIQDNSIVYKGSIPPWEVPQTIQSYHFFVLPTQGENFGHAIFDALASGVPIIISSHTPWKDIDTSKAGFYIDIDNPNSLKNLLESISLLSANDYNVYRTQSLVYASTYLSSKDYVKEYDFLIG